MERKNSARRGAQARKDAVTKRAAGRKGVERLRAQVVVHGIVQGVFFRASTREQALRIGVGGWVRNLPDGTVQALFEGEKKKVEEIVAWCHQGPPGGHVDSVDITWGKYQGEYTLFEIRYGYSG